MFSCTTVLQWTDLRGFSSSTVVHRERDIYSLYGGWGFIRDYYYYYYVVQYCTTTTPPVSSRAKITMLLINLSHYGVDMKITSIRIDPTTSQLVTSMGLTLNQVFQRGLVALAIEGKIRDPRVLALIKRYQGDLIEHLEAENILMNEIVKRIDNTEQEMIGKNGKNVDSITICQFCDRELKEGRCSCNSWLLWARNMKVIRVD